MLVYIVIPDTQRGRMF